MRRIFAMCGIAALACSCAGQDGDGGATQSGEEELPALEQPAAGIETQGVPAPYVTKANGSDPHTKPCTYQGQAGICLFTSQDLEEQVVVKGYPSGQSNSYPMMQTLGYFSTDGIDWKGPFTLMTEATYRYYQIVPRSVSPVHLWAPSAQQGADGNWYLYVPDLRDPARPAESSVIGVSMSTSGPMGPYTPIGWVDAHGYGSDPDVVDTMSGRFGTSPYLFWADGDDSNCGGISMAPLDSTMRDILGEPARLTFNGIPESFGTCKQKVDRYGRSHPYMEGPHVYNTSLGNWPAGVPGPFLMVVSIKPQDGKVPPECAADVGQPGTPNQVVAWMTAPSVTGPWTYGGILMCGSQKEWTIQGSVIPVTTSNRTGGHWPLLFIYHDGPGRDSRGTHRTLHAECLYYGGGKFAGAMRIGGKEFADSGAVRECLGSFDGTTVGLQSPANKMFVSQNGDDVLVANRYGIGTWERFTFYGRAVFGRPPILRGVDPISPTEGAGGPVTFTSTAWGPNVSNLSSVHSASAPIIRSIGRSDASSLFDFTFDGSTVSITSVETTWGIGTLGDGRLQASAYRGDRFAIYHH